MIEYTLNVENLDQVQAFFKKAPQVVTRELSGVLDRVSATIWREAMEKAPVNKNRGGGNLRQSLYRNKISDVNYLVGAKAKYAGYVDKGTRPHRISPKNAKMLRWQGPAGPIFAFSVMHPGTRPQPFFTNAVKKGEESINKELKTLVTNLKREI